MKYFDHLILIFFEIVKQIEEHRRVNNKPCIQFHQQKLNSISPFIKQRYSSHIITNLSILIVSIYSQIKFINH
jgi:hypothetical protein